MVAVTADKVVVELEARLGRYNANVNSARQNWDRSMSDMRRAGARTETAVTGQFRTIAASIFTAYTARQVQLFLDAATRIQNSLKVAGLSGDELERVYGKLFDTAQRNAAPLETLAQLYGRAALAQKELGASTEELLAFTENVAVALRVSGKSAAETRGALIQLSQAIGAGIVRAEEFNSILEGALPIAQAAAAGLEEAGGSVAKLRTLIIDGKVSSEAFFRAFEAGAVILNDKVAGAQFTVEQQFLRLTNSAINAAKEFNEVTKFSDDLGQALSSAADSIDAVAKAFSDATSPANQFLQKVIAVSDYIWELRRRFINFATLGLLSSEDPKPRFNSSNQSARRRPPGYGEGKPETVSLGDFPIDGDGKKENARIDAYERATKAIKEQTLELTAQATAADRSAVALARTQKETELLNAALSAGKKDTPELRREITELGNAYAKALGAQNWEEIVTNAERATKELRDLAQSYGLSAVEADTLAYRQGLVNEALRIAGTVTPEVAAEIDRLTESYRQVRASNEGIEKDQKNSIALQDELRQGFIDVGLAASRGADNAADALGNLARRIVDTALELYALKPLMEWLFDEKGTSGGGIIGSLAKSLGGLFGGATSGGGGGGGPMPAFADGGITRGPSLAGEAGPEAVVPLPDGRRIPVNLQMPPSLMAGSGGGGTSIQVINNTPSKVETQTSRGSDGREIVQFVISEVKKEFAGGGFDKAQAGRYGVKPTGVRR